MKSFSIEGMEKGGVPKFVSGLSGTELAWEVLNRTGKSMSKRYGVTHFTELHRTLPKKLPL